ncbi:SGNH/GDSL hydrolase family protein [Vibrio sp. 10N.222.51.C5]|uniref:SGNH/GDSL hydrolase family protein n=1 Tax=Vibrio sp. 10N.222.51.C5 TaxID=3229623 RepID=UPI00354E8F70
MIANATNEYNIINLSLGGCTSLLLAYQIDHHFNLLSSADLVIIEPIVNDISYLPNKLIEKSVLFNSIEYIYGVLSKISCPIITLLIPTQKRLNGYKSNEVYLKHIREANQCNVFVIDLFPHFRNYPELGFLDPGHIGLQAAWSIGKSIQKVITYLLSYDSKLLEVEGAISPAATIYKYLKVAEKAGIDKSNSRYSCKTVSERLTLKIAEDCLLVGFLHWCDINDAKLKINVNACKRKEILLKSKYLRISSPNEPILLSAGDLITLDFDRVGGGLSELIFQFAENENTDTKNCKVYCLMNDFINEKIHSSILSSLHNKSDKKTTTESLFSLLKHKKHYQYARNELREILFK